MKKVKKLLCMLVAVVMVLGLTATAFAEETTTTGTITIYDAIPGQTYSVYQILDLESYDKESNAYAYKAADGWSDFLASETSYVKVDNQGYVTWIAEETTGTPIAEFAKRAKQYAVDHQIAPVKSTTAPEAAEGSEQVEVKFTGLDLGYYLVDTTLGTLCSLNTTNPDVVMEEKNEVPTSKKEVEEDSKADTENAWGDSNDADIDQVVNYKATIEVKAGAENYVLYDKMSEGLTFNKDSVKVMVGDEEVPADKYTVTENVTVENVTYTFEVKFDNEYIASAVGKTIVVTYSATLNENAVIAGAGNPNEIKLQYGDESKPSYTPVDTTTTYTWEMNIVKYTEKDGAEVKLEGAKFTLSKNADGTDPIKFSKVGDTEVYKVDKDGTVTEITTTATGTFQVEGLDSDTYYLTETKAPDGYNKLAGPVKIVIDAEGEVSVVTVNSDKTEITTSTENNTVKVLNQSGTELPSTGGMGTTVFYLAGGILVLAAIVLLVTKRRMNAE